MPERGVKRGSRVTWGKVRQVCCIREDGTHNCGDFDNWAVSRDRAFRCDFCGTA